MWKLKEDNVESRFKDLGAAVSGEAERANNMGFWLHTPTMNYQGSPIWGGAPETMAEVMEQEREDSSFGGRCRVRLRKAAMLCSVPSPVPPWSTCPISLSSRLPNPSSLLLLFVWMLFFFFCFFAND